MHSILFYYLFYIRNEEYEEEYTLEDSHGDEEGQGHGVTRSYPIHDWSPPTTDLSPIEDVPSNMELEAEAEWLAYQSNGEYGLVLFVLVLLYMEYRQMKECERFLISY